MDKHSTEDKEQALVALLASCRKEPKYGDDFEQQFLHNFHLRKEADQATQSTWKLLLERLDNYLQNFRGWQWVYASMSLVTMMAIGVIIASGDGDGASPLANDSKGFIESKSVLVSEETQVPVAQMPTVESATIKVEQQADDNKAADDGQNPKEPTSKVLIEM